MKKIKTLSIAIFFGIIISCGIKVVQPKNPPIMQTRNALLTNASARDEVEEKNGTPSATEPLGQQPTNWRGHDRDVGQPSHPPSIPTRGKEFSYVDERGVWVEKKDGVQITTMPNGERYILPDKF